MALITGGASGIGQAIGRYLAEQGVKVALLDRDRDRVEAAVKAINGLGLQGDVSDAESAESCFARLDDQQFVPRILVNAAGILGPGKILGKKGPLALEEFTKVIAVNLSGAFNMLRLAASRMASLPELDDGERGVIINIGSIAAEEGQIGQAAYSAAKAGLAGLTLPAARELARHGIRVVTIAPGLVETSMLSSLSDEARQQLAQSVPFPKRLARPAEIAHLVRHVIENVMLNGSVLRIDGALRMGEK